MEKSGRLLLFHFDHLSGEETGALIEMLQEWGASDVQIIPTVTKKNRPGQLALVDVTTSDESRIAGELTRQFGISGYHRLETAHCHRAVTSDRAELTVRCGTRELKLVIGCKHILAEGAALPPRVEFDDLRDVARRVDHEFGSKISIPGLRGRIETLLAAGEPLVLDVTKDA
jgi:uncharacterized protein (DUF111 family)